MLCLLSVLEEHPYQNTVRHRDYWHLIAPPFSAQRNDERQVFLRPLGIIFRRQSVDHQSSLALAEMLYGQHPLPSIFL